MSTFLRYIKKELVLYSFTFFVIFALLFTFIIGTINIRDYIGFNPPFTVLLKLYVLTFFHLLSLLIPLSAFFGTLITFYKLREDRELVAFFSLGFNFRDFLVPVILFVLLTFILTHICHFYLLPYAKREKKIILVELNRSALQKSFPVKKPVNLFGNTYIYIRGIENEEETKRVTGILLFERDPSGKRTIYHAEKAEINFSEAKLALINGLLFSLSPEMETEILHFGKYLIHLNEELFRTGKIQFRRGEMTISELKSSINELRERKDRWYFLLLSEYFHRHLYALSITPIIIHALFLSLLLPLHHRTYLFITGIAFYTLFYYGYNFFLSLGERGNLLPLYSFLIFNTISLLTLILEFYLLKRKGFICMFR